MSGRRPRLTVFGTGYLGTAHAACLASLGFEVLGVDVDAARARGLQAGILPFYEPGLEPLLRAGLRAGRLAFTTSYPAAAEFGDVHFICVGTPQRPGSGGADLTQFESCFAGLAPLLHRPCLVVGKSTVPPGTAAAYGQRLPGTAPAGTGAELAWNPEFLREGHAVADTLRPDRVVAGVWSDHAAATLREVYAEPLAAGVPFLVTDPATAELVKVAARIRALGARVAVFDPAAMDRAGQVHPDLDYRGSVLGAARDADVLLLLTEWPEFAAADPMVLAKTVARRAIVDARHALDAAAWRDCGWDYRAPGRPGHPPGTPGAAAGRPAIVPRHDLGPRDAEVACLAGAI